MITDSTKPIISSTTIDRSTSCALCLEDYATGDQILTHDGQSFHGKCIQDVIDSAISKSKTPANPITGKLITESDLPLARNVELEKSVAENDSLRKQIAELRSQLQASHGNNSPVDDKKSVENFGVNSQSVLSKAREPQTQSAIIPEQPQQLKSVQSGNTSVITAASKSLFPEKENPQQQSRPPICSERVELSFQLLGELSNENIRSCMKVAFPLSLGCDFILKEFATDMLLTLRILLWTNMDDNDREWRFRNPIVQQRCLEHKEGLILLFDLADKKSIDIVSLRFENLEFWLQVDAIKQPVIFVGCSKLDIGEKNAAEISELKEFARAKGIDFLTITPETLHTFDKALQALAFRSNKMADYPLKDLSLLKDRNGLAEYANDFGRVNEYLKRNIKAENVAHMLNRFRMRALLQLHAAVCLQPNLDAKIHLLREAKEMPLFAENFGNGVFGNFFNKQLSRFQTFQTDAVKKITAWIEQLKNNQEMIIADLLEQLGDDVELKHSGSTSQQKFGSKSCC